MNLWIILGIIVYYIISGLIFMWLIGKERLFDYVSDFEIIISLIPIIRFIYYIHIKF